MRLRGGPGRAWHGVRRGLRGKRRWVWTACLLAALVVFPVLASPYHVALGLALLANVALASSWALFSGPTRYLSLAAAAFYGAGAYTTAVFAAQLAEARKEIAAARAAGSRSRLDCAAEASALALDRKQ